MTSAELLAQGEDSEATPKQKQKNKGDPETAIKVNYYSFIKRSF